MKRLLCALAALLVVTCSVLAAEVPIPPSPDRWVTDTAGFLSPDAAQRLDGRLQAYERDSGHQVIVWIGTTTGDTPTEDWTIKAFEKWKVGRKGLDDGLVLFVFSQDHKVRIEVGYGLEGVVPDAIASRIINEGMVPLIRKGDNDAAVEAGVDALLKVVTPESAPAGEGASEDTSRRLSGAVEPLRHLNAVQTVIMVIIGLAFLILLITHPGMALWLLFSILSGGGGGGGGSSGGGGGFSGGGGGGGGGGATGSW